MMKRLILSMVMIALTATAVWASRALSIPFEVTQPDGTSVTVILNGDAHCHWLSTMDGMIIVEQNKGYYVATISDDGELKATKQLAHDALKRTATEQQLFRQQQPRCALLFNKAEKAMQAARRAQVTNTNYFPHTGTPKTLVILANFSDVKFTSENANAQFDQYCNGETMEGIGQNGNKNLTSVRRYFEQSSHGLFNPQFVVIGPVEPKVAKDDKDKSERTMAYYGAGSASSERFAKFCREMVAAVDDVVDFNDYDNDGDGDAELVCIIYAGYGQNIGGNPENSIWPKCSLQSIATNDASTKDPSKKVYINYMNCGAELFKVNKGTDLNGAGTFIHEMSHGMGLADHYVRPENTSVQVNNQSPEFWDLMDYGEHANNGYHPVPYTAWEQEVMGWITVEELTESQDITDMKPLMKEGGKAYKFGNGANSEEWMYFENVQAPDVANHILGYNQNNMGHGLLVSHVAYKYSVVNMGDYPNNEEAHHPRISIVPADGEVINGYLFGEGKPYKQAEYVASLKADPFPSTYKKDESPVTVTALTADMGLPNYMFYNGEAMPKQSLTDIKEENGVISFFFNDGTTTGVKDIISKMSEVRGDYYNLNGQRVTQPTERGIYIQNGKKIMVR